jgi:hypothetical protein
MYSPAQTLGSQARILPDVWMLYVYVFSVFVLSCVGSGLATSWSPVQGVLPTVCKIRSFRLILNGNRPQGLIRQRMKKTIIFQSINLNQRSLYWLQKSQVFIPALCWLVLTYKSVYFGGIFDESVGNGGGHSFGPETKMSVICNTFTATLHIWWHFPPSTNRGCDMS